MPRGYGLLALVALVVQNTSLVIFLKLTFREGATQYAPSTVVFLTEFAKLTACSAVNAGISDFSVFALAGEIKHQGLLFLPSLLYVVQNNLLFFGAKRLPTLVYILCSQTKILITAVMSRVLLGTQITKRQYFYLILLIIGIVTVQYQTDKTHAQSPEASITRNLVGILAVVLASVTSGTAGVVLEKIFKTSTSSSAIIVHTIWTRNIQLSLVSIPFAAIVVCLQDPDRFKDGTFFKGYDAVVWVVVVLQAIGGIIIAYVMKFASNILKCLAVSISICCCTVYSVTSGELELSVRLVVGVFLVCTAVGGFSMSMKEATQDFQKSVSSSRKGISTARD